MRLKLSFAPACAVGPRRPPYPSPRLVLTSANDQSAIALDGSGLLFEAWVGGQRRPGRCDRAAVIEPL